MVSPQDDHPSCEELGMDPSLLQKVETFMKDQEQGPGGELPLSPLVSFLESTPLVSICESLVTVKKPEAAWVLLSLLEGALRHDAILFKILENPEYLPLVQQACLSPALKLRQIVGEGVLRAPPSLIPWDAVLILLKDEDCGVGDRAVRIFLKALDDLKETKADLLNIESEKPELFRAFSSLPPLARAPTREEIRFRVLSLAAQGGQISEFIFRFFENLGLMSACLEAFFSDDLLFKMNAVGLISFLSSYPSGRHFLRAEKVLKKLEEELSSPSDSSIEEVVLLALGGIFGDSAYSESEKAEKKDDFSEHLRADSPWIIALSKHFHGETTSKMCALKALNEAVLNPKTFKILKTFDFFQQAEGLLSDSDDLVLHNALQLLKTLSSSPLGEEGGDLREGAIWKAIELLQSKPFSEARPTIWEFLKVSAAALKFDGFQKFLRDSDFASLVCKVASENSYETRRAKWAFVFCITEVGGREGLGGVLGEQRTDLLFQHALNGFAWAPTGDTVEVHGESL